MEHQTGKLINSFDHKNNYKELTKKKIKVCFFTYRPMWNLAKDLSKKLYGNMKGNHGASTITNVALSNFLEKHGCVAPQIIKDIKSFKNICISD